MKMGWGGVGLLGGEAVGSCSPTQKRNDMYVVQKTPAPPHRLPLCPCRPLQPIRKPSRMAGPAPPG